MPQHPPSIPHLTSLGHVVALTWKHLCNAVLAFCVLILPNFLILIMNPKKVIAKDSAEKKLILYTTKPSYKVGHGTNEIGKSRYHCINTSLPKECL